MHWFTSLQEILLRVSLFAVSSKMANTPTLPTYKSPRLAALDPDDHGLLGSLPLYTQAAVFHCLYIDLGCQLLPFLPPAHASWLLSVSHPLYLTVELFAEAVSG
jgi:hypothetical protein